MADAYPTVLAGFGVYVNLTNMNGIYDVALQLLRVIPEEPGTELIGEVSDLEPIVVADPLKRVDFGVNLEAGTEVPAEGRYVLRLLMNGRDVQDFSLDAVTIG